MKIFDSKTGGESALYELLAKRNNGTGANISSVVAHIIQSVKQDGDAAVRLYAQKFGDGTPDCFEYTAEQIDAAAAKLEPKYITVLENAARNITEYHKYQMPEGYSFSRGGRSFGRIVRPLERVGLYVPGGTAAYPSTVLMNCIPAKLAGVEEIIITTPSKDGTLAPMIAAAAKIAGATRVFAIGGVQAIAALAFGTETIPKVDKITGPGNMYVAEAKRQVFGFVDIDMIAGPSEVLVIADETANADFVAADMLSQLEHDEAAAAVLLTTSNELAEKTKIALETQLKQLSRAEIATTSAQNYAVALVCESIDEAMRIANNVAPEHLELQCENARELLKQVKNAGSVFIGAYTTEPLGDYYAGTNHVLPTNGSAKFSSPLSVDDFVKKFSYLEYDRQSFLEDADDTILFAKAEGLDAHAQAVRIRK